MTRIMQTIHDVWVCIVKRPPDDASKGLEWLRAQEREAHEEAEQIRQRRIRQTERAFMQGGDFLDSELFGESRKRKGRQS